MEAYNITTYSLYTRNTEAFQKVNINLARKQLNGAKINLHFYLYSVNLQQIQNNFRHQKLLAIDILRFFILRNENRFDISTYLVIQSKWNWQNIMCVYIVWVSGDFIFFSFV